MAIFERNSFWQTFTSCLPVPGIAAALPACSLVAASLRKVVIAGAARHSSSGDKLTTVVLAGGELSKQSTILLMKSESSTGSDTLACDRIGNAWVNTRSA